MLFRSLTQVIAVTRTGARLNRLPAASAGGAFPSSTLLLGDVLTVLLSRMFRPHLALHLLRPYLPHLPSSLVLPYRHPLSCTL
jgi:hypothetical protein